MAGNTAIIDRTTLERQWSAYLPMGAICQHWTVTVHQLIRLREAWGLPPRNDRRRRHKPTRADRILDPSPAELAASENSLNLAPLVAQRVTTVQATWSDEVRRERMSAKPTGFSLSRVEIDSETMRALEEAEETGGGNGG
jgi:hypothetical protein